MNLAPVGCFPRYLVEVPHGSSDLDAVREYNEMLKETVSKTRQELVGATVVYDDTHSVLLDMFQHPEFHGMKYGTQACCGYGRSTYNNHPKCLTCQGQRMNILSEAKDTAADNMGISFHPTGVLQIKCRLVVESKSLSNNLGEISKILESRRAWLLNQQHFYWDVK